MKLAMIMATRGRPEKALAAIECLRSLSSGDNELEFIVACDDDDDATISRFAGKVSGVRLSVRPRPVALGECWNRCVPLSDADAYLLLTDDGFAGTMHWDKAVSLFMEEGRFPRELACFAWNDTSNRGMPTILGASREWLALTGDFYDARFPFWFSDIGFAETWSFVTGEFLPILPITMNCWSQSGGLRDMGFWWDFYAFQRTARLELAGEVRRKLGLPAPASLGDLIAAYQDRDRRGRAGSLCLETMRPPTPEYRRAKAAAAALMEAA